MGRKLKQPLFFFFLLNMALSCSAPVWQRVDMAQRQGDLPAAVAELENHLQLHPQDARALYRLGEIYGEMGQWEKMVEAFERAVNADARWERDVEVTREYYWTENLNRGIAAFHRGAADSALTFFHNATIILPRRPLAHRLVGEAARKLHDLPLAQQALETTLQLDSLDHRARRLLMRVYFDRENFPAAIREAATLLRHFPEEVEARRTIAYAYDRLDDRANAGAAYQALLRISAHPRDYQACAAFMYRLGEYEQAIELSRQAIRYGGDAVENLRAIAQVYLMQHRFEPLIETAQEILKAKPDDLAALQLLQIAYAALDKRQELQKITQQIEEIQARLSR
ncbi:MAG: hypothetical protein D6681_16545 [Calditrichaeota bacterium]|nr:MAG: hypothetical protein D6681_16545 [Calditrichota bacterium]